MKRATNICALILATAIASYSQKPAIDTSAFMTWPTVQNATISNNGYYYCYAVVNLLSVNNLPGGACLYLKSSKDKWEMKYPDVRYCTFSKCSRQAFFINLKDTLFIVSLGGSLTEVIPMVESFQLFTHDETEFVVYKVKGNKQMLKIRNLETLKEQTIVDVTSFVINKNGYNLLLNIKSHDSDAISSIDLVSLKNNEIKTIWRGERFENMTISDDGCEVAILTDEQLKNGIQKGISYFKDGMKEASPLPVNLGNSRVPDWSLDQIVGFSSNGTHLYFTFKVSAPIVKPGAVMLDIWNYRDVKLQSQQLQEQKKERTFTAVLDLNDTSAIPLENDNEKINFSNNILTDDKIVILCRQGDQSEWYWNRFSHSSNYLESSQTGEKKKINLDDPYIKPGSKYVIGWAYSDGSHHKKKDLFAVSLTTNKTVNLTHSLPYDKKEDPVAPAFTVRDLDIIGWLNKSDELLVRDKYDIWQVDETGQKKAINLTNGFGRRNKIQFSIPDYILNSSIKNDDSIIISAFDLKTKESGFFKIKTGSCINPVKLVWGPYFYSVQYKARDSDLYIVQRESAMESPNYFFTSDFRRFSAVSNIYPEKKYNWLTSQLLTFRTLSGKYEQGILYTPENFDSLKRYPVILFYYQTFSDELYQYKTPGPSCDFINIPWFVSRGYIVFVPDIHYINGKAAQGAYETVVGAAKLFLRFRYIDAKKMGIQGHSWGGYETKYILTHSNMFAAAMASSGMSDLTSDFGSLWSDNGVSKSNINEIGQTRMMQTPWDRPDLYMRYSPIYYIKNVTTPVLMMNNIKDGAVNFTSQGVSFFNALRRLGKKAWMLQYDGQSHSLDILDPSAMDLTLRMTQFFDHYLKGAPAPKWMTEGIPAKMKGVDNGLELEPPGIEPGKGLSRCPVLEKVDKK